MSVWLLILLLWFVPLLGLVPPHAPEPQPRLPPPSPSELEHRRRLLEKARANAEARSNRAAQRFQRIQLWVCSVVLGLGTLTFLVLYLDKLLLR